jgi:enoyl-CoA hydratase/carnithine racemase/carbon monoxide dehydrogenase subunit G
MMEMVGEARLNASRERVWAALNDPAVLKASIPGCESLEQGADGAFMVTVVARVGPIKARFEGKLSLSEIVEPRSYTLTGEGSGGAAGFAKARIGVSLEPLDAAVTLLRYTVSATVGGKLAQLGSRMVDAAARKTADDFFGLFAEQVSGASPDENAATFDLGVAGGVAAKTPAASAPESVTAGKAPVLPAMSLTPEEAAAAQQAAADVLTAELVKVWIADQIAVVTLNRPKQRNAMTYDMWRAMPVIFGALERNPDVRVVILTGAGADFCAGADIAEFSKVRDDVAQSTAYEVAVDACCDAIHGIGKPTIAVVRGYCLGGGAHLAMSCDFRYAAAESAFGIPAARLSIIYGVRGTRKLLSLVGLPMAKKILYGAQRFDAPEALRIGFIDHVAQGAPAEQVPWWARGFRKSVAATAGDPMVDARLFSRSLVDNAPLSISGAKILLNGMAMHAGALDLGHAEALIAAAAASEDYREGRAAFGAKRSPQFQGR